MKFEYTQIAQKHLISQTDLKHLGEDGWELVCTASYEGFLAYYFKRMKSVEVLQKAEVETEEPALQKSIYELDGTGRAPAHDIKNN